MSTLVPGPKTWPWPTEVLDFAHRHQVAAYLDPLLEATRQVFPTARELKVLLEADPELRDDWHIVFEVCVPSADLTDYLQAQHRWTGELYRICPAPLVGTFRLTLVPVG
jgi:hypothetical protein